MTKSNILLGLATLLILMIGIYYINIEGNKNEKKILFKNEIQRDDIRIGYLNEFSKQVIKPIEKKVGPMSFWKTSGYFFNIKDEGSLKEYFNRISRLSNQEEYNNFLIALDKNKCSDNENIFKAKKYTNVEGIPEIHFYIAICLENITNHTSVGRNDHGFLNNYYEFYIGNWDKEEILEGIDIVDVDLNSSEYSNLLVSYKDEKDLSNEYRNIEKQRFINNFSNGILKEKIYFNNKYGNHYEFFIFNENDLEKYFLKNSGLSIDDEIFDIFNNKKDTKSCGEKDLIFKYKENKNIYIGLCLENGSNLNDIGNSDNGFFENYIEFKIGDWKKDEILN